MNCASFAFLIVDHGWTRVVLISSEDAGVVLVFGVRVGYAANILQPQFNVNVRKVL